MTISHYFWYQPLLWHPSLTFIKSKTYRFKGTGWRSRYNFEVSLLWGVLLRHLMTEVVLKSRIFLRLARADKNWTRVRDRVSHIDANDIDDNEESPLPDLLESWVTTLSEYLITPLRKVNVRNMSQRLLLLFMYV